jgi:hypothetical protein
VRQKFNGPGLQADAGTVSIFSMPFGITNLLAVGTSDCNILKDFPLFSTFFFPLGYPTEFGAKPKVATCFFSFAATHSTIFVTVPTKHIIASLLN